MDLVDVTDIALPEGDVLKIQDVSGTVLWEKRLNGIMPRTNVNWKDVIWMPELRCFCAVGGTKHLPFNTAVFSISSDGKNWIESSTMVVIDAKNATFHFCLVPEMGGLLLQIETDLYISNNCTSWSKKETFSLDGGNGGGDSICYNENRGVLYTTNSGIMGGGDFDFFVGKMSPSSGVIEFQGQIVSSPLSGKASSPCVAYSQYFKKTCYIFECVGETPKSLLETSSERFSDWEIGEVPSGVWNSMCWSSKLKKFCAVGEGTNHIALSSDGKTWTGYKNPAEQFSSVCWGEEAGLFCAVSKKNNVAFTSPDGINWTEHQTPDGEWQSVCWSPRLNMFCAVGNTDNVFNLKV